ncbi:MAG TPA: aminotransferase class I/II-fold pyridoxal phosphate-dependent enzyme [Acidimicrobiales bacterium]|nr:aminotransferase class I/II-fold pyridoxal phosphate-dependent enzyme [Acidimicrobiales bacterium]
MHDFERYGRAQLSRRRGEKWSRDGGKVLAAWVADMDFPVAPAVHEAIGRAVDTDDLGYPAERLRAEVRAAFADRLRARYDVAVSAEDVLLTFDVVQGICAALMTLTGPGDGVLFLTPAYPPFSSSVRETGRRPVTLDLEASAAGYRFDAAALERLVVAEGVRCLLLCNPHNPTGRVLRRDELEALALIACAHDLVVVSDEIHADLTLPGAAHTALATLGPEIARRTVTLTSASKTFNLAGLGCAAAVFGSPALRERFAAFPPHLRGSPSSLGLLATLAAYEAGGPWLEDLIAYLARQRALVAGRVAAWRGVAHVPPEGTYLAWLDMRGTGLGDAPAAVLQREAGVALQPGGWFGPAGRGHARLNFATPRPVLAEALDLLEEALRRLAAQAP